jgi:glycosyltransferase involved in cell wall biosynthesis
MSAVHRALGTWTDQVDAVVFPSSFAREKYATAGWPRAKLFVKYNTARLLTDVRRGPGSGFVVISRLSSEKGLDVLVDAWRCAFPHGGETLTVIGSGEDEMVLRRAADGADGISFLGAKSPTEVRTHLANARALVMPSRCYEVFPRTIAEAFGVGVPVIASRLGALAEIVDEGESGLLVESESVEGFAAALTRLSGSPDLSTKLGAGARAAYEARFSPEQTTVALTDIYRRAFEARTGFEARLS